jgi:ubiquinone/menaquinone biosynthesis C-methylase UbiE
MFAPGGPTFLELAEQALSSTDRGYDLLAPKFDRTPFRTPDEVLRVAADAVAEAAPSRVLDVCCGTGAAMQWLRPVAREAVVGVDRSRGMLAQAARNLASAPGAARVALVRGDALALPFLGTFDAAVCFGAFGHILERDEPAFVRSVRRALRPGGRFVFATAPMPPPWHPARLLAHGFNAAMRVRNALLRPEFVMYYLTFMQERATALLRAEGFEVTARAQVFPRPYRGLRLVVARRP